MEEYAQAECNAAPEQETNDPGALEKLKTWHRRLGHVNVQDLIRGERSEALRGLDLGKCKAELTCEICLRGKMTRTPFPKESERETELLEIIHSDLCGPIRVQSIGHDSHRRSLMMVRSTISEDERRGF